MPTLGQGEGKPRPHWTMGKVSHAHTGRARWACGGSVAWGQAGWLLYGMSSAGAHRGPSSVAAGLPSQWPSGCVVLATVFLPSLPGAKLDAVELLLHSFGSAATFLNSQATRCTCLYSLDFDPSGTIVGASVRVRGWS